MKRIFYFFALAAVAAMTFVSCNKDKDNPDKPDINNLVEDGFYVSGPATGSDVLKKDFKMAEGLNEADGNAKRDGMYEKYVVLEAGKEYYLVLKEGTTETRYSASLADFETPSGDAYNDNPAKVSKGLLVTGTDAPAMKAVEGGMYHIVLDLNKDKSLEATGGAQIAVLSVPTFGVRGSFNGWGYDEMKASTASNDGTTYTIEDVDLAANAAVKFATNNSWKVTLDDEGKVKANTNLGTGLVPGAPDITVAEAGMYTITLTFKLAAGDVANSFSYNLERTGEGSPVVYPTELYMIGSEFGGWDWNSDGVVRLAKAPWKDYCYTVTRKFTAGEGFKFNGAKAWDGSEFGSLAENGELCQWTDDGNLLVPETGVWTISINLPDGKLDIQKTEIYITGPCTGLADDAMWASENWVAGNVDHEAGTATVTAPAAGDLRTFCKSAFDWWQCEFKPTAEGGIIYRGLWVPTDPEYKDYAAGDNAELPAFEVEAGTKVTFNFNAGTAVVE